MKKVLNVFSSFFLLVVLALGVFFLKDQVNFSGKASGTPANLVVDLGSSFSVTPNVWSNIAQGGEETGRSLSPVVRDLTALKPRFIRIDHMYDFFHVVRNINGQITYNWEELDLYLSDIKSTGATPFLALSYTPEAFGVTNNTDIPKDLNLWTNLVRATVEHVSGRNGLALSGVYYEVWNEPDLFGQFKVYPPKNYLDLYRASVKGAVSAQNVLPFKIGGPATTNLYQNWFDSLVKLSIEENARLDFFSWHQYAEDMDALDQSIKNVTLWTSSANKSDLELFVTESGIDAANNPDYDSIRGAIHTISEAAVSADKINGLFSFEAKDGPGPSKLWGRWGLLTHEKWGVPERKPRFNALSFLNLMSGSEKLNIAGVGSFVKAFARVDDGVYRILVVNFDPNNKHVEAVPIKVLGIPFEKISVKRTEFSGGSVNVPATVINKEWTTVQYFRVNSASIFEISEAK